MLYKVLNEDGSCCHGGSGSWSLPTKLLDGSWEPGEWREVEGKLIACQNGLHGCDGETQLPEWLGPLICEMEYEGERIDADNKIVVRRARLTRIVETWDARTARLFACDCAERVLALFERVYPNDARPREAIETARRFTNGQATMHELSAAYDSALAARAASDDAGDASAASEAALAASAVGDAASVALAAWAAGDAVWAARAAASATAGAAERQWQGQRLRQYLEGAVA